MEKTLGKTLLTLINYMLFRERDFVVIILPMIKKIKSMVILLRKYKNIRKIEKKILHILFFNYKVNNILS